MVKPVIEGLTRDRHTQAAHVGEVRQAHPSGRMGLREDHGLIGTMHGPPCPDPPFERAAHAVVDAIGMAPGQLAQNGDRPQLWRCFQHWHDLLLPEAFERIGSGPVTAWLFARRGRTRIPFDPASGRDRNPRDCRSAFLRPSGA